MDIEEGDYQVAIVRIDLSGVSCCGGGRRSMLAMSHTGVTRRGVNATYSSRVGRLNRTSAAV